MANHLTHLGVGQELFQIRTGHNIGKITATGVHITGTDEAISAEMDEVFSRLKGEKGMRWRETCERVRVMIREDMEEGESRKNMERLADPVVME